MSETDSLLPISSNSFESQGLSYVDTRPTPKHILKIALRVKQLIDIIIPISFNPTVVTRSDSPVINERIIQLVKDAAGGKGNGAKGSSSRKYRATLIFVLLTVKRWYDDSADLLLFDAGLYELRSAAAESIAQRIIEDEQDERYLFRDVLCSRYSITLHGKDSEPANALELAVDLHSTSVIATSGYQRCINWLWRGWIIQDSMNPNEYVFYRDLGVNRFATHFTPDRLKTPNYQNYIQLIFCFVYLGLFTLTINTLQKGGDFDVYECFFYLFTFGEIVDDLMKIYHLGWSYIGFWNIFNDILYVIVTISFSFRMSALQHSPNSHVRQTTLLIAYRLLACCAPFVWLRILLYLESLQFFGVMLVCLSQMIRESVIFFVLLVFLCCGFLQAFVGLDASDGSTDINVFGETVHVMLLTVMDSPDFETLNSLAWPYGKILYYMFTFIVTSLLLNILIALFGSAYNRVYDNATDEYLTLQAEKTLRFVRAPDSYVYVPPLNIVELCVIPFKSCLGKRQYQKVNYAIMYVVYWPILLFTAHFEAKTANRIQYNRMKGMDDDANEHDQEWDLLDGYRTEITIEHDDDESEEVTTRRRIAKAKRTRQLSKNMTGQLSMELEQMKNAIKSGDPEFHIDDEEWQQAVLRAAPKIELGDHYGSGWENYWLIKEFNDIKQGINVLKKKTDSSNVDENEEAESILVGKAVADRKPVQEDEEPPQTKTDKPKSQDAACLKNASPAKDTGTCESKESGVFITKDDLAEMIRAAVAQALLDYEKKSACSTQPSTSSACNSSDPTSSSGKKKPFKTQE